MEKLGKIFTGGTFEDIKIISLELYKIGVKHFIEGNILYFYENEVEKLPTDEAGPYLPCDYAGYSFYKITDNDLIV